MFCPQCGQPTSEIAKFCPGCGRAMPAAPAAPAPQAEPAAPADPAPAAAPFRATHVVSDSGAPTWPVPEATAAPGPRLDPRVDVAVLQRQGSWAQITCSNGWSAWTDGHLLVPRAAPLAAPPAPPGAPPPVPATPPPAPRPVVAAARPSSPALVGAGLVGVSALFGWMRGPGLSSNGFDVPLLFLADYKTTSTAIKLGLLLLGLAAIGLVGALQPNRAVLKRVAGTATLVVVAVYIVQFQRLVSATGNGSLFSNLGFGAPLALAGGLALTFEAQAAKAFHIVRHQR